MNLNLAAMPDIVADGAHIPLGSETIDTVICLETLEHVKDPPQVVRELSRVLRPEGALLMSVPFLYRIHGVPNDFWRFTEYQVQRMVNDAGLRVVCMERLGLLLTVICDMTKQAISEIRMTALRWLLGLLFLPLAAFLVGLERAGICKHFPALTSFTTGYLILAVKPRNPGDIPPSPSYGGRV